ncbi:hypothetical protein NDU88_003953 [Pleurodeles waltl]|uniref:Uncharacterized protein n=1 Tax=Pleurodeles waltl TaxID=8319 RepID=A0AAV7M657_PLEWA|nr:hypothetical protein NDU88_003953 [Pleurodeles waltl]
MVKGLLGTAVIQNGRGRLQDGESHALSRSKICMLINFTVNKSVLKLTALLAYFIVATRLSSSVAGPRISGEAAKDDIASSVFLRTKQDRWWISSCTSDDRRFLSGLYALTNDSLHLRGVVLFSGVTSAGCEKSPHCVHRTWKGYTHHTNKGMALPKSGAVLWCYLHLREKTLTPSERGKDTCSRLEDLFIQLCNHQGSNKDWLDYMFLVNKQK